MRAIVWPLVWGNSVVLKSSEQTPPQMPFGGVGASGWGRFGSRAALEEFTELRWITIQSGFRRHHPI